MDGNMMVKMGMMIGFIRNDCFFGQNYPLSVISELYYYSKAIFLKPKHKLNKIISKLNYFRIILSSTLTDLSQKGMVSNFHQR